MLYPGNLIFWNPITLIDGYKLGGKVTKVGVNYRWSKNPLIFKPIKQNTKEEWRTLVFKNGESFWVPPFQFLIIYGNLFPHCMF